MADQSSRSAMKYLGQAIENSSVSWINWDETQSPSTLNAGSDLVKIVTYLEPTIAISDTNDTIFFGIKNSTVADKRITVKVECGANNQRNLATVALYELTNYNGTGSRSDFNAYNSRRVIADNSTTNLTTNVSLALNDSVRYAFTATKLQSGISALLTCKIYF
jgi:hypothetical protein